MKVQYVFCDQYEFGDPFPEETVSNISADGHDIILYCIVPFADQFYDYILFIIVRHEYFHIQGARAEFVPLWMDIIIVNSLSEFKFGMLRPEEGRAFVL